MIELSAWFYVALVLYLLGIYPCYELLCYQWVNARASRNTVKQRKYFSVGFALFWPFLVFAALIK